jgi:hypothetical protein
VGEKLKKERKYGGGGEKRKDEDCGVREGEGMSGRNRVGGEEEEAEEKGDEGEKGRRGKKEVGIESEKGEQ